MPAMTANLDSNVTKRILTKTGIIDQHRTINNHRAKTPEQTLNSIHRRNLRDITLNPDKWLRHLRG